MSDANTANDEDSVELNRSEENLETTLSRLDAAKIKSNLGLGLTTEDPGDAKEKPKTEKKEPSLIKKILSTLTPESLEEKLEGMTHRKRDELLASIKVTSLPQRFLAKYIGKRPCDGIYGIKYTRTPVDLLVKEVKSLPQGEDIPLLNIKVMTEGLKISLHQRSRSSRQVEDTGMLQLPFISYAVQDPRYMKIVAVIVVREMSAKKRVTECLCYLCDGIVAARYMALSIALSFRKLEEKLGGQKHQFKVDLRKSLELEKDGLGADC